MVDNRRKSTKIYIRKRVILVHSLQESYKTLPAPAGTFLFRSVSGRGKYSSFPLPQDSPFHLKRIANSEMQRQAVLELGDIVVS